MMAHQVRIEIYPASYGDCFLVSCCLDQKDQTNILIDGGLNSNFAQLKKRLIKQCSQNQLLSLVVVTHFDRDHIAGIIKLLNRNGKIDMPKIIPINEIWHNGFKHIHLRKMLKEKYNQKELNTLNYYQETPDYESEIVSKINAVDSLNLTKEIFQNGYDKIWNSSVNGEAIVIDNIESIKIGKVKIILLSPDKKTLKDLDTFCIDEFEEKTGTNFQLKEDNYLIEGIWEKIIVQNKDHHTTQFEKISYSLLDIEKIKKKTIAEDLSIANKSSISFILEYYGKKILFCGDAGPSLLIKKLELLKSKGYDLYFDAIKVSHHGSNRNTNQRLLELIDSRNFIISTNGLKFQHPNIETLIWIVSRPANFKRNLIFNYRTEISKIMNEITMKNKFNDNYNVIEINPDMRINKNAKENVHCLTL